MKLILEILILLFSSLNDGTFSVKEKLKHTPNAELPFECTRRAPWGKPGYAITKEEYENLPIFTYANLGLTEYNNYDEEVTIFRKFTSGFNNYCIVALEIGVSDPGKQLLVTYDNNGKVLDFLEAGVYDGGTKNRLCLKQWRIDNDRKIIVTWIKALTGEKWNITKDFSSIQGQRIDYYYQIDENGKFYKIKEVTYQPKNYPMSYLRSDKNLWEGNESIKEEISFD